MRFNKPCIKCGVLSLDAMCRNCHRAQERIRDRKRDATPERKHKKATLYNGSYKRQAKLLRDRGGICYLCGEVVAPGTGQADHLNPSDPQSPLAITHSFCNQSRGDKKLPG